MQIVLKIGNIMISIAKFSKTFKKLFKIILNFPTLFKNLFRIFLHFNYVSKFLRVFSKVLQSF